MNCSNPLRWPVAYVYLRGSSRSRLTWIRKRVFFPPRWRAGEVIYRRFSWLLDRIRSRAVCSSAGRIVTVNARFPRSFALHFVLICSTFIPHWSLSMETQKFNPFLITYAKRSVGGQQMCNLPGTGELIDLCLTKYKWLVWRNCLLVIC